MVADAVSAGYAAGVGAFAKRQVPCAQHILHCATPPTATTTSAATSLDALGSARTWAPPRLVSLLFSQGPMPRSSRRWTRSASAPPAERPAPPRDMEGGFSAEVVIDGMLRLALCKAIVVIDKFLAALHLAPAGQHAEACTNLNNLKLYLANGPGSLLQAACWLSKLCLAMPAQHETTGPEKCLGMHLRECMRCTQDCIGLGMILDTGMASELMGLDVNIMDLNTRSRILYARGKQSNFVAWIGDGLIKMTRTTPVEPEATCPGMGGAASSSMEMEPRYAWLSAADGPAPAP